ncbi:Phosphoserine phosphatase [compost metagenome]
MTSIAFAFDLDGTVTRQELLPLIASELGLQREMRLLTELTLKGAIAFEDSFRLRCAVLRSIPISTVRDLLAEAPLDDRIADFIRERPEQCFVVTGNLDVWVAPLIERLGCGAFTSKAQVEADALVGVATVLHKSQPIRALKQRFERVVAIGESVNDIPMFEVADVGVAYGGVHAPTESLVDVAHYVTYDGEALCRLLNTL